MLKVSIDYHFNALDYPLLKKAAELYLPELKPTHRLELLSRWSGFSSLASLNAAFENHSEGEDVHLSLNHMAAKRFSEARGISFDASLLHHVLASAAHAKIAREYPHLHGDGFGRNSAYVMDHEERKLRTSLPTKEYGRAVHNLREKRFYESRKCLLDVGKSDEFIRALALCSALTPIKTINRKQTSYNLKHRAEERGYSLGNGVTLPRQYVSNSTLIAAAFYSGFYSDAEIRSQHNRYPNICFNISQKSLNTIIANSPKQY